MGFLDLVEASGSGNSRGAPKTQTANSTRVNLPSKADAEAVVTQILHDALGRDPDKGELARYSSLLIGKAQANPRRRPLRPRTTRTAHRVTVRR